MTIRIEMPQLSSEGESAVLASWLVKAGDIVEAGEIIAELETDKSTVELESPASGVLEEIVVAAGTEDVTPGTLLATIKVKAGAVAIPESSASSTESDAAEGAPVASESSLDVAVDASTTTPSTPSTRTSAMTPGHTPGQPSAARNVIDPRASTPLARRAAEDRGLDLTSLDGSGPGGRILEADVLRGAESVAVIDSSSAEGSFETVRLSAMRKTIARRMTESKQQVPHFYLSTRCSMDVVLDFRARLNAELSTAGREIKISVNDFIVKATALALQEVPAANVRFAGDEMHVFDRVDIAVAVATEGGLVTPIVRNADRKGLTVIAEEVKELAQRARSGGLRPDEYQDGTFTISNLGMYGIETVYPILNLPQACILGVGAAEEQPVVRDGQIGIGRVASITLAADHRVVDGAVGAELLAALRGRLEDPLAMML
jgi:pyruvate dehydrogenase E2 component (dihydrolipoyllysine-residue acetyltransferase)